MSQSVFGYAGVPFLEDESEFETRQMRTQTPVRSTPEREVHDLAVEMNLVGVLVSPRITVGAAITEHDRGVLGHEPARHFDLLAW